MPQIFLKKLQSSNFLKLLVIVFLSCGLLIFINFFTIKTLSASRGYVNGESHYSKAQKDAVRHLIIYMYTQDRKEWELFNKELKVPEGDGIARVALLNHDADIVAKNGFKAGRIKEEDFDDLIWLFKNFKNIPFMARAIKEWEQADNLIKELHQFGNDVYRKVEASKIDAAGRKKMLLDISILSDKLTITERNFSNTLGDGTHTIKVLLVCLNIVFILIIITAVSFYYSIMVKRLISSQKEVEAKNENLLLLNKDLDKFVYSVSHDLRSPITSLKGLIGIAKSEDDSEQINYCLDLMNQSLDKQDQFISDIIDYSKNKRSQILLGPVNLRKLLDDAVNQHNYMTNADKIIITKDLSIDEIQSDGLRLKIILNNLLSNAIKYVDESKDEMRIAVRAYNSGLFHVIEIEDNGIGIPEEYKANIFDMFFVIDSNKGSGLGLYIVKETLDKLNGSISVFSQSNIGTKFTVKIPNLYGN
ncbi:sensor histidine kinase [Flavobacterium sp. WC2509]|uniref:sensor histidine kinase n=1 Tax=Flavobacterium sp. WC2509 TaxID=3461406 RepID=UPI004043F622